MLCLIRAKCLFWSAILSLFFLPIRTKKDDYLCVDQKRLPGVRPGNTKKRQNMKLTEIVNYSPADWPYKAVDHQGGFHVFKSRTEKRRWLRDNEIVGQNNPLHRAQNREAL